MINIIGWEKINCPECNGEYCISIIAKVNNKKYRAVDCDDCGYEHLEEVR